MLTSKLAYIDLIPLDTLFGKDSLLTQYTRPSGPVPMSLAPRNAGPPHERSGSFHHLFLDIKALIASPCAVGETVELYFSLYDSAKTRFVTEEFVAIYNHLGSPARDPEQRLGKVRTIFTDLKLEDLSPSTYLVCRIVRNGAMRIKPDALAPGSELGRRTSTYRGSRGDLLTAAGTSRRASSIFDSSATDDSFSITSGFGANTLHIVETVNTATTNVIEGRPSYKRPFGCAVLALPQLQKLLADSSSAGHPGVELSMPIHVPREETAFATMHDDLIAGRVKNYQISNRQVTLHSVTKLTISEPSPSRYPSRVFTAFIHSSCESSRLRFWTSHNALASAFRTSYIPVLYGTTSTSSSGPRHSRPSPQAVDPFESGNQQSRQIKATYRSPSRSSVPTVPQYRMPSLPVDQASLRRQSTTRSFSIIATIPSLANCSKCPYHQISSTVTCFSAFDLEEKTDRRRIWIRLS